MIWVGDDILGSILELPKDITGGPWYFEQEFDTEFVDIISQFVRKVLTEEVVVRNTFKCSLMDWI